VTAHHASALAALDLADFAAWCVARRAEAVDEIDADPLADIADSEWPAGSALPWEYDATPCTRRSRFDVGVSDARLALASEVLS
jgi:uncharacterized protein (DUF1684 family)